jgi:hypothetical protein
MPFVILAGGFFGVGVLLLLHHGWKHGREDPATSHAQRDSCPEVCYFQVSDVGNFRTCNHEMWILSFWTLALVCLLFSMNES